MAKKRFENKLGFKKNLFSQLKEYCGKPFEKITDLANDIDIEILRCNSDSVIRDGEMTVTCLHPDGK